MTTILIVLGILLIVYLALFLFYFLPKELKDHEDIC